MTILQKVLTTSLSVLHNYFDSFEQNYFIFSDLYFGEIVLFPCTNMF